MEFNDISDISPLKNVPKNDQRIQILRGSNEAANMIAEDLLPEKSHARKQ